MNQASYEYNKEQLLSMGFGTEIARELQTKMEQNLTEFMLNHKREFGKDNLESVLYFSKGDDAGKDLTFFNRYDATLKKEGMEDLKQTYFVGQRYNYTLQERYNMMEGRAVYREQPKMERTEVDGRVRMVPNGETYMAWRGLDFTRADRHGNFNPKVMFWKHEQELMKYPIKGGDEKYERNRIMRPLEKGNAVDVVLLRDGIETHAKVVANPKMMRMDFYDADGQAMVVRKSEKQAVDQSQQVVMTPQEVQRAAIARAAEQVQPNNESVKPGDAAKQQKTAEQEEKQGQRRRNGVRV